MPRLPAKEGDYLDKRLIPVYFDFAALDVYEVKRNFPFDVEPRLVSVDFHMEYVCIIDVNVNYDCLGLLALGIPSDLVTKRWHEYGPNHKLKLMIFTND